MAKPPLQAVRNDVAQRHMDVLGVSEKIYNSGRLDRETFHALNADGNRYLDRSEIAVGLQDASRRELKKLTRGLDALEEVNGRLPRYLNATRGAALSRTAGTRFIYSMARHGASSQLRFAREDKERAEKKINDAWRDIASRFATP